MNPLSEKPSQKSLSIRMFAMLCLFLTLSMLTAFAAVPPAVGPAIAALGAQSSATAANSIAAFTVPAGTNRLLVVTASHADNGGSALSGVTFGASAMTQAVISTDLASASDSIWILKLGSSASSTTATITVTPNAGAGARPCSFVSAQAFANVDQSAPTQAVTTGNVSGNPNGVNVSSSITLTSSTTDLVFDLLDLFDSANSTITSTPGGGQTVGSSSGVLDLQTTGTATYPGFGLYKTSTKVGSSPTATTTWTTVSPSGAMLSAAISIKNAPPPPAPTVASINPASGPTVGGNIVTISGTDFTGATGVTIGGNPATNVTVASNTSITCTTPVGTQGTASVLVTTPGGTNAANTLYTYTRPTAAVVSLNRASGNPTNAANRTFQIIFSQPVSGLTAANFALVNSGLTAPAISDVGTAVQASEPDTTWNITVSTGTGSGTLGLNLSSDAALSHEITNSKPVVGQVFTVDKTPPVFTSITRQNPLAQNTNADSLVFRATFSEDIVNLDVTDFNVSGTTATITAISGTGPYDITVSGGDLASLNGTVGLALASGQDIVDRAGNSLPGTAPATNETYILDNTAPTVVLSSTAPDPAPNADMSVTVQFNEAVTGFLAEDISVANATFTAFTAVDGDTYTFTLRPTGPGTVTVNIAAAVAQDAALNDNIAATQFSRSILLPPTISYTYASAQVAIGGAVGLTYAVTNPNPAHALTGLAFTDALPAGLAIATPNGVVNNLGGTVNAVAGTNAISLTGGTLAAGATATLTVNVTGTAIGIKGGMFTVLTSAEAPTVTTRNVPIVPVSNNSISTLTHERRIITGRVETGDSTQTGRINRFGVVSVPGTNKAFPGIFTTSGERRYDSHTLTNTTGVAQDVHVWVNTSGSGGFAVAYLGSFDPANLATNYLADTGNSFTAVGSFGFTIPVGGTVVLVVHELNPGTGVDYALGINTPLPEGAVSTIPATLAALPTIEVIEKSVSIADLAAASEGNSGTTNFTFTITRNGPTTGAVNMTYTVSGAAVNGTDFVGGTLPTGTATIPDGSATTTVSIPVSGDTTQELDEAFTVALSAPDNGYVVTGAPATSTITNDDPQPTVSINSPIANNEGNSGTSLITFTATLSNPSSQPITVNYATADGTATTTDSDYTSASGTLTFSPGDLTRTFTVAVNGDTKFESNENYSAVLSSPTNATLATSTGTGTITNDDAQPTIAINGSASTNEGNSGVTTLTFTATLSNASSQSIAADYSTANGTATTADADYVAASGTLTFAPGELIKTFNVTINGDTKNESNETFTASLSNPNNTTISSAISTGTITNDDAVPTLAINSPTAVTEGDSGTKTITFTANLSAISGQTVTVGYSTSNGTATIADGDYVSASGILTFAPGDLAKTFNVTLNGDTKNEANETFSATLASATNATIATPNGTGTINNDDPLPTLAINSPSGVTEPFGGVPAAVTFTVSLSSPSGQTVTVNYSTANGTAVISENDYTATSGTVTFLPGETSKPVTVTLLSDDLDEDDETFVVNLSAPTNATLATAQGAGTIIDFNVSPLIQFPLLETTVPVEGDSGVRTIVFRVQIHPVSGRNVSVDYTTVPDTATAEDFTPVSGTLVIPPGQTDAQVTVNINPDRLVEPMEQFFVRFSNYVNAQGLGASAQSIGIIIDDDQADLSVVKLTDGAEQSSPVNGAFRITQSLLSSTDTVVNVTTTGTGTSGADYTAVPATVTIPAGQTHVDVPISVLNDNIVESSETVTLTLGSRVSTSNVTAGQFGLGSATLNITDNDVAASIAVNSGSGQSATVNTAFASPLVAVVRDSGGVALQGASVTFTAPAAGASGAFGASATVVTNALGLATAPAFTANTVANSYAVTAATPGVVPTASFSLTNTAGAATQFAVTAPGSAIAGVPVDVTVRALDAFNNVATAYPGTASLTSTDTAAILPANNSLPSGSRIFSVNFSTGGNQTVTATDTVSSGVTGTSGNVSVSPRADLAITISDAPDPVNALGNITYTIGITNNGPSTSVSPVVTLPLPAITTFVSASGTAGWTPGTPTVGTNGTVSFSNATLASGASASFTVVAKVDLNVVNNSTISATVTATQSTTDPATGNESATATTTARSGADLVATLTAAPEPVIAGTDLTYTLQVKNNGPLDADNAALSFTLPAGTTFVSLGSNSGWTGTTPAVGSSGIVSITNSLFANAGDVSFPLVVKVGSDVVTGSVINATLVASSTTIDVAPGNESPTATSNVITRSDLELDLTGTPTTAPKGSDITYTLSLLNKGPSDAVSPSVSFPIPTQMTFVSASAPSGWTPTAPSVGSGGTVTFTRAGLANAADAAFTVVAKVNTTAPNGTIINATATASATGTDPVAPNNSDLTSAAVGTVNPTALQLSTLGILNRQNGLFELTVNVTNTTPLPINGFRLRVNYASYLAAHPSLRLQNPSSPIGSSDVYVDYPYPVAVDGVVPVKLAFFTSNRSFPNPFTPILSVEALPTSAVSNTNGSGVQPRLVPREDGNVLIEFPSIPGRWYRVRYSHDMVRWFESPIPIQASNNRTQWIDSGAPLTMSPPSSVPSRFYLVNEINVVPAP